MIGDKFRGADQEFLSFPIEDKAMLNDIGKIINTLIVLLKMYRWHSDEDIGLKIRQANHNMRLTNENIFEKFENR